jgi:hypothetical protein
VSACLPVLQVKSKSREVQLHKDSSLGEAVLECYASGNKNVFSLGFVPVAGDNTVVLLARDTPANSPAVRDLGIDMSQVRLLGHPGEGRRCCVRDMRATAGRNPALSCARGGSCVGPHACAVVPAMRSCCILLVRLAVCVCYTPTVAANH